ncbi:MAG: Protein-glutamate methylesterase, partial [uncultured Solirubrobacteraceae bacterium]
ERDVEQRRRSRPRGGGGRRVRRWRRGAARAGRRAPRGLPGGGHRRPPHLGRRHERAAADPRPGRTAAGGGRRGRGDAPARARLRRPLGLPRPRRDRSGAPVVGTARERSPARGRSALQDGRRVLRPGRDRRGALRHPRRRDGRPRPHQAARWPRARAGPRPSAVRRHALKRDRSRRRRRGPPRGGPRPPSGRPRHDEGGPHDDRRTRGEARPPGRADTPDVPGLRGRPSRSRRRRSQGLPLLGRSRVLPRQPRRRAATPGRERAVGGGPAARRSRGVPARHGAARRGDESRPYGRELRCQGRGGEDEQRGAHRARRAGDEARAL